MPGERRRPEPVQLFLQMSAEARGHEGGGPVEAVVVVERVLFVEGAPSNELSLRHAGLKLRYSSAADGEGEDVPEPLDSTDGGAFPCSPTPFSDRIAVKKALQGPGLRRRASS
ncbi:hypothetical protein D3C87_1485310 [compost metagenome]